MKNIFILLAILLSLSACNDSDDTKNSNNEKDTSLKLDREDSLTGIDKDNNGIRDDIDGYINKTFADGKEKKAVQQVARAYQQVVQVDNKDKAAVVSKLETKAIDCYVTVFDDDNKNLNSLDKIEEYTFNTKKRAETYENYQTLVSGSVMSIPEGDNCEK